MRLNRILGALRREGCYSASRPFTTRHRRDSRPDSTWRLYCSMSPTEQIGEYASRQIAGDIIDLGVGHPSPSSLPLDKIQQAAQHRLGSSPDSTLLLQYGPRGGYPSFRAALAAFLSSRYGSRVGEEELVATAGVSQALDLICRVASNPGDIVLVERPTYFLAQKIFDSNRLQTVGITADAEGLDTDALELWLRNNTGPVPKLLYTVPVHNNPCGTILPGSRREHLVKLAHEFGFSVLADEVYQMLSFSASSAPPPVMRTYDDLERKRIAASRGTDVAEIQSRVVSVGSFSKILAPGLRLGWVDADVAITNAVKEEGFLVSGGCIAPLACGIAHSAMELGLLEDHLDNIVRPRLAASCAALCQAVRTHIDGLACGSPNRQASALLHEPSGGYFVWVQLPDKVDDTAKLLKHCVEQGFNVRFTPGSVCGGGKACVRLCFAFYTPEELEEGVRRLALAVADYPGS